MTDISTPPVRLDVYVDRRPHSDPDISAICNCAPTSGCGEHCLNRLVARCRSPAGFDADVPPRPGTAR